MSYSCYESDYRNQEQYVYLRDMALKKTQTQQTTKNESTQKQEASDKDDLKERVITTLSSNKEIELIAK